MPKPVNHPRPVQILQSRRCLDSFIVIRLADSLTLYLTSNATDLERIINISMVCATRGNLHNTHIQSYNIPVTSELTGLHHIASRERVISGAGWAATT